MNKVVHLLLHLFQRGFISIS